MNTPSSKPNFEPVNQDYRGEPLKDLPVSEYGVIAGDYRVEIYPPLTWEVPFKPDRYVINAPYSSSVLSLSINDGPFRRIARSAGSFFFAPPGTTIRVRTLENAEFMFLTAAPRAVEEIIDRVARSNSWTPQVIENFSEPGLAALQLELRRSLLHDALNEPTYLSAILDGMFSRVACKLLDFDMRDSGRETLSPGLLRRLIAKIDSGLDSKILVEDLAAEAGLSRFHFSRAFQAETGETPQDFIIGRRVSEARELLVQTKDSISEIAMQVGFSSHAHLSATFKKRMGVSPSDYRKSFDQDDL